MKKLKLFYAAGPGEVIEAYRFWKLGQHDNKGVVEAYSSQFYQVCANYDADFLVISRSSQKMKFASERGEFIQQPKLFDASSNALLYHVGNILYGIYISWKAIRFRADFALINEGTTHWFILVFLSLFGIKVVPVLHNPPWPPHYLKSRTIYHKMINSLNGYFLKNHCYCVLTASDELFGEIRELAGKSSPPSITFLPTYLYRKDIFNEIKPPEINQKTYHILFAGRVIKSKGIYLLLQIASRLKDRQDIHFDICGSGADLMDLKTSIGNLGLTTVSCHGYCDFHQMKAFYQSSYIIIVPSLILEGFNQVAIESILTGRPVVISNLCPAKEWIKDAAIIVNSDDVNGYINALLALLDNHEFYKQKQAACNKYQPLFYDPQYGFGAALEKVIHKNFAKI